MRLRELRKLVEQLSAGGAGGGVQVVEASAEIDVTQQAIDFSSWTGRGPEFHPLGPISLEAGRFYGLIPTFQAKSAAGDSVAWALWDDQAGMTRTFGNLIAPEAYDTTGTDDTTLFADNFTGGNIIWFSAVVDTDFYLLFGAADSALSGPPSAPVQVRNRRFAVLPI